MTGVVPLLAGVHEPLTDAFPRLRTPADAHRFALTAAQQQAFDRDGFVGGLPILDPDHVRELRRRVDALVAELPRLAPFLYEVERAHLERPGEVVCHFLGGWRIDPWLHDLVFAPSVTVPCAQVLGLSRLRLWHDQVFVKPPRHPGSVPWHQDYSYWQRATPARHVTLHVVLDDADETSGAIHYVPGSHRWPLLPKVAFDAPPDALLAHVPDALRDAFAPVPMRLRAGMGVLHHSHTVHGSPGNRSERPRRALVVNFMAPDTRCADGGQPLLAGVPKLATGAVIEGDAFPIVLDLPAVPTEEPPA